MINVIPFEKLANYDYGWLNAHYHFSFSRYYDPARLGFGRLRVVNDDIVAPGKGFAPHPHDNMEIITYVRSGAITHKDSAGNEGRTEAGDVQVMSAGTGITHSEYNRESVPTSLYQIWILPRDHNIAPRWDARKFPKDPVKYALPLLVSGRPEHHDLGALPINADAAIYAGRLEPGTAITQTLKEQGYLLVSDGAIELDGQTLRKGDAAEITDISTVEIKALEPAEVLLIDVAA